MGVILNRLGVCVLTPIQLDREFVLKTIEVNDEPGDRNLSTKFKSAKPASSQFYPKPLLCIGGFIAHHPRETSHAPSWIAIGGHLRFQREPSP